MLKFLLFGVSILFSTVCLAAEGANAWFGIRVVDDASGRGIPLVELRTVNDIWCVSDNAGWIAFQEPGLMDREVFFYISSAGYEAEKDGFGYTGVRLKPAAGKTTTVKMKRRNVAERLGRLTGQGMYRDSELLGLPHPLPNLNASGVMGQDSIQAVPYQGKLFYLWGDTNVPFYPLGNYRTTCATTELDAHPEKGLAYQYFMNPKEPERVRQMMPMESQGAVWLFGLLSLPHAGKDVLLAHFGRHAGLSPALEQGIAQFNDAKGVFECVTQLDKGEPWRYPRGHAVRVKNAEGDWFYFSQPFLHTRVAARLEDIKNPASYEARWFDATKQQWTWQKEHPPTTADEERKLKVPAGQAMYQLTDAATGAALTIHGASIQWNEWRKRWILIGIQMGSKEAPSYLGEVWYAESPAPEGPWLKAVKVVSHPRYSYYNPIHHGFFDKEGGRVIFFEGTYTLEFSGNPIAPARYDYNQLMYRLELDHPALKAAQQ